METLINIIITVIMISFGIYIIVLTKRNTSKIIRIRREIEKFLDQMNDIYSLERMKFINEFGVKEESIMRNRVANDMQILRERYTETGNNRYKEFADLYEKEFSTSQKVPVIICLSVTFSLIALCTGLDFLSFIK